MARTSTYLNFMGNTRAAFDYYRSVLQDRVPRSAAARGDAPASVGMPPLSEAEKNMVMHVALPIVAATSSWAPTL